MFISPALHTALDAEWLQKQRQKGVKPNIDNSDSNFIFWESQVVYANPQRKASFAPRFNEHGRNNSVNLRPTKRCYNCIESNYYSWNCPKKIKMTGNIGNLIDNSKTSKRHRTFCLKYANITT